MSEAGSIAAPQQDTVTTERARIFALLGRLLVAAPDAGLLSALTCLRGERTPLGTAYGALAREAAAADPVGAEREFHDLFIGLGRGELLPFGSYYLTGFLHERPLAALRADLARIGVERTEGVAEPEDHIGSECEVYAGLLSGAFAGGATAAESLLRAAPAALGGAVLRGSRTGGGGAVLSRGRHAGPRGGRDGAGSLGAAGMMMAGSMAR